METMIVNHGFRDNKKSYADKQAQEKTITWNKELACSHECKHAYIEARKC